MTKKIVTVEIDADLHLRAARIALERGSMPWRAVITEALSAWVSANAELLAKGDVPDMSDSEQ
jgi:hypothetical protein